MAIASSVRRYLDAQHARFDVLQHPPTSSAMQTAEACHIPSRQLAKAVLVDTEDGRLLAVLPADHRIQLTDLRMELGQKPKLADEEGIRDVFIDCVTGAIPALGSIYGLDMIIDESLQNQPDVYFEAGDHLSLIHMDANEYARLTPKARHGRFSEHWADQQSPMQ